MKTLIRKKTDTDIERELREQVLVSQRRIKELEAERTALEAELAGKPQQPFWQAKGVRQRRALSHLHDRVVAQRLVLRLGNQLGHLPSRDEFRAALSDLPQRESDRVERYLKTLA